MVDGMGKENVLKIESIKIVMDLYKNKNYYMLNIKSCSEKR